MAQLKHKFPLIHKIRLSRLLEYSKDPTRLKPGEVCAVDLTRLRPTQATVGFIQAYSQARKMSHLSREKLKQALLTKPIPVVIGPDRQLYVIDHHHHAASLWSMGLKKAVIEVKENCLGMSDRAFWGKMRRSKWLHLYDRDGRELQDHRLLPKSVMKLDDNIYQSLAWATRKAGGYAKSAVAVSDFRWPDFLRERISDVTEKNFGKAVKKAVKLARSPQASGLPGHFR